MATKLFVKICNASQSYQHATDSNLDMLVHTTTANCKYKNSTNQHTSENYSIPVSHKNLISTLKFKQ